MLARLGFVAKGVLWAVVALIAIEVARGDRRKAQPEEGAIEEVARQPFGEILLIALAVGLAGYGLWRLKVAIAGPRGESGFSELAERIGSLFLAGSYFALCVFAIRFLTESGNAGGSASSSTEPDSVTRSLLDEPFGVALIVGIGLVLFGVAAYEAKKALGREFMEDLETGRMSEGEKQAAGALGLVGHASLAVISGLAGVFMVKAAIEHDPKEAVGLDGALQELLTESLGPALLYLIAAGLLTYAAYCLFEARYRKL